MNKIADVFSTNFFSQEDAYNYILKNDDGHIPIVDELNAEIIESFFIDIFHGEKINCFINRIPLTERENIGKIIEKGHNTIFVFHKGVGLEYFKESKNVIYLGKFHIDMKKGYCLERLRSRQRKIKNSIGVIIMKLGLGLFLCSNSVIGIFIGSISVPQKSPYLSHKSDIVYSGSPVFIPLIIAVILLGLLLIINGAKDIYQLVKKKGKRF